MIKNYSTILFIAIAILAATNVNSQVLTSENFDGTIAPALPANWNTTTISSIGWRTDSSVTNISTGYPNASGIKNMVIKNSDSSGTYTLTSPSFSTIGQNNIKLIWASRVSTNFPASGSTTPVLEYSINGGTSWTLVNYTENSANSVWAPVNAGNPIQLPANANNILDLKLRWTITIVNNLNGTYRMDDFSLLSDTTTGLIENERNDNTAIFPNPFNNQFTVSFQDVNSNRIITLFDMLGNKIKETKAINIKNNIDCTDIDKGTYIMVTNNGNAIKKIVKN
jgi:hypothetical protein